MFHRHSVKLFYITSASLLTILTIWIGVDLGFSHLSKKIETLTINNEVLTDKEQQNPNKNSLLNVVMPEKDDYQPINVLLIGSDSRFGENGAYGNPEVFTEARSDTTMVLHLSGDRKTASLTSFPRDLLTNVPCAETAELTRLNQAYALGGVECTVRTISQMSGIPIDHVVEIDFSGFKKIVDSVGGITVCLNTPVSDADAELQLPAGEYVVNGEQALALARARYSLGDGSDTMRVERQHVLVENLIKKITQSDTYTNPTKMYRTLSEALSVIKTDSSLSNVTALLNLASKTRTVDLQNITFQTVPTYPSGDGATLSLDAPNAQHMFNTIIQDTLTTVDGAGPQNPTALQPIAPQTTVEESTQTEPATPTLCKETKPYN